MELSRAIKERRSVRSFTDKAITEEEAEILTTSILFAPSAGNLQSRHFHFVYNRAVREELSLAAGEQDSLSEAPLVIVGSADLKLASHYAVRGRELYSIQDVSCAAMNLMLTAHSLGLGSVWVGAFDEDKVHAILSLDEKLRPIAMVPVGTPAEEPAPPPRVGKERAVTVIR